MNIYAHVQSLPQPSEVKTAPAKSPPVEIVSICRTIGGNPFLQKVKSKTMLFGPKWDSKSQLVEGKSAKGVPQVEVSILDGALLTSPGIDPSFRAQNQILISESVRSIAYL